MNNRITIKHIQNQVDILNEFTGQPQESYTKKEDGKYSSNVGCYHISQAYGGCKLEQIVNEGGGVREITYYRMTKRELDYVVQSMNNMLRNGQTRESKGYENKQANK